jgi:hypothetical protein
MTRFDSPSLTSQKHQPPSSSVLFLTMTALIHSLFYSTFMAQTSSEVDFFNEGNTEQKVSLIRVFYGRLRSRLSEKSHLKGRENLVQRLESRSDFENCQLGAFTAFLIFHHLYRSSTQTLRWGSNKNKKEKSLCWSWYTQLFLQVKY